MTVFTDGSCSANHIKRNMGGWAYVIINDNGVKIHEDSGKEMNTTNNRMEMIAVLNALTKIAKTFSNEDVTIFSDSEYVVKTLTLNWRKRKNNDLWDQIIPLITKNIHFKWCKGHTTDNIWNNYVDKLANDAYRVSYILNK